MAKYFPVSLFNGARNGIPHCVRNKLRNLLNNVNRWKNMILLIRSTLRLPRSSCSLAGFARKDITENSQHSTHAPIHRYLSRRMRFNGTPLFVPGAKRHVFNPLYADVTAADLSRISMRGGVSSVRKCEHDSSVACFCLTRYLFPLSLMYDSIVFYDSAPS